METRTQFVFLLHPKEFKKEKAATGRLTHLCLTNSKLHMGVAFDSHVEVQSLIHDSSYFPVLLYPGENALNLSELDHAGTRLETLNNHSGGRPLRVFILDATWALGAKMLRLSPTLQRLPRIMFTPTSPSRYIIKQQPHPTCLSTLEATHELLLALHSAGLDTYPLPDQLLGLFARMQDFQMKCAADPNRAGYRRRAYTPPSERAAPQGRSGARRVRLFTRLS